MKFSFRCSFLSSFPQSSCQSSHVFLNFRTASRLIRALYHGNTILFPLFYILVFRSDDRSVSSKIFPRLNNPLVLRLRPEAESIRIETDFAATELNSLVEAEEREAAESEENGGCPEAVLLEVEREHPDAETRRIEMERARRRFFGRGDSLLEEINLHV